MLIYSKKANVPQAGLDLDVFSRVSLRHVFNSNIRQKYLLYKPSLFTYSLYVYFKLISPHLIVGYSKKPLSCHAIDMR